MKILLLGPNGQVGWELQRALAPLGSVTALARGGRDGLNADLGQPDRLGVIVRQVAPDVIVNAAAYTAVDRAEEEPEVAHAINAAAPSVLAAEARGLGAWLVHYSTDYVFNGSGERPWHEGDATGPLNVYGSSKGEGDLAVQESGCRYLIFRTSWVYAARGKNFIRTMLNLAAERDALQIIGDQYGAPTGAELIADVTAQILARLSPKSEAGGLYHLAADGETTWHEYARFVIGAARDAGWPTKVQDDAIENVSTGFFPVLAQRPLNSRLDCTLLQETFGIALPDWRSGVLRALQEVLDCEGKEAIS